MRIKKVLMKKLCFLWKSKDGLVIMEKRLSEYFGRKKRTDGIDGKNGRK